MAALALGDIGVIERHRLDVLSKSLQEEIKKSRELDAENKALKSRNTNLTRDNNIYLETIKSLKAAVKHFEKLLQKKKRGRAKQTATASTANSTAERRGEEKRREEEEHFGIVTGGTEEEAEKRQQQQQQKQQREQQQRNQQEGGGKQGQRQRDEEAATTTALAAGAGESGGDLEGGHKSSSPSLENPTTKRQRLSVDNEGDGGAFSGFTNSNPLSLPPLQQQALLQHQVGGDGGDVYHIVHAGLGLGLGLGSMGGMGLGSIMGGGMGLGSMGGAAGDGAIFGGDDGSSSSSSLAIGGPLLTMGEEGGDDDQESLHHHHHHHPVGGGGRDDPHGSLAIGDDGAGSSASGNNNTHHHSNHEEANTTSGGERGGERGGETKAKYCHLKHDPRLREAISMFGFDSWKKVAEYVGPGISSAQVRIRWRTIDPSIGALKAAWQWSADNDVKLAMAVGQYGRSWVQIADYMGCGVTPQMCACRWNYHLDPVAAKKKSKSRKQSIWSTEKDSRLTAAVEVHGKRWAAVAEYVGDGILAHQCLHRWTRFKDPQNAPLHPKFKGPWTPEEDKRLEELFEQYKNAGSRGGTHWPAIAKILGRRREDCSGRWPTIQARYRKQGAWTEEETQELVRLAGLFADQPGKWTRIGEMIGRGRDSVLGRWRTLKERAVRVEQTVEQQTGELVDDDDDDDDGELLIEEEEGEVEEEERQQRDGGGRVGDDGIHRRGDDGIHRSGDDDSDSGDDEGRGVCVSVHHQQQGGGIYSSQIQEQHVLQRNDEGDHPHEDEDHHHHHHHHHQNHNNHDNNMPIHHHESTTADSRHVLTDIHEYVNHHDHDIL